MSGMKLYRKKNTQPMRPYIPGEDLNGIGFFEGDTPEEGGMIAQNPDDLNDVWYVSKTYFENNYEAVD